MKRKLEVVDTTPSPRRMTRACARMERGEGLKNAEADKPRWRTRVQLHDNDETMKERATDSEKRQMAKGRIEGDDEVDTQRDKP
ncbi:unnamed protein product [Urochloa humidicola]